MTGAHGDGDASWTGVAGPVGTALPFDDGRHLRAHRFLVEEAALLDARGWRDWLSLMTPDIRYVMPVRVTTAIAAGYDRLADMAHFDEDLFSLEKRVHRLETEHAWTEDPPSRTRHVVTNVLTYATDVEAEIRVASSLLLFRSRGDLSPAQIVCAGRNDVLREVDGEYRLCKREIQVEESVLRTQNLAIFL